MFAVLALLAGCVDYQEGLFASIEREERIPESNLPKVSSVFGMVKADGKYYVSLGKLYERNASGGDWDSIGPPPGFNDSLAADIVDVGGTIYVAYNDYELGASAVFILDTATDTWNPAGNLYDGGKQITDLFSIDTSGDGIGDELFMAVLDSGQNYDLLYDDGSPDWLTVVNNRPRIIAGTYVGTGNHGFTAGYVFLSRARAHIGSAPTLAELDPVDLPSSTIDPVFLDNEDFGGILYLPAPDDDLYVSSRQGHIYYSNGGAWSKSSTDDERPYTGMVWFDQLDSGTGGVVVGVQDLQSPERPTEEGGYYELPGGGVGTIVAPEGNGYATTDMSETTVIDFFVDTDASPDALFVLTYGQGLWRGEYGSSDSTLFADPQWTHE